MANTKDALEILESVTGGELAGSQRVLRQA